MSLMYFGGDDAATCWVSIEFDSFVTDSLYDRLDGFVATANSYYVAFDLLKLL